MSDDEAAKKAAEILAVDRQPDRAEQAAIDYLRKQAWVLWHADDYAVGVVRLLSRAGLLRDHEGESEAAEAGRVMRRLEDEDVRKLRREYSAALAEIDRLHGAESNAEGFSGASAGVEASGGTQEAQEGSR